MAKRSLAILLDEAVEATLAKPHAGMPAADPRLAELVSLAADLRGLPREGFRASLKANLARGGPMRTAAVKPVREGFHTVTPYLTVAQAAELIDFVKQAFDAQELLRGTGSAGGIHAEVRIGDSIVMIGGGGAWRGTPMPTSLHLYVKDADAVYQRALDAGATSIEKPVDQPYGDREAGVEDLAGNHWYIATHKGERPTREAMTHVPEGLRSVTPYLHPRGAPALIGFLKEALGAEEVALYQAPDATVQHAKIRIGDSIVEMGEAHGPYQPMPTTFFLYVEDVDRLYERAVGAGALSLAAPADQPYGDRVAGVKDPSDNVWYIATHTRDVAS